MERLPEMEKLMERMEQRSWIPACGETEVPFTKNGYTYLYMYNTYTKKHALYCQTTDLFLSDSQYQYLMEY